MADTHSRRATYQDILDLPANQVGELIRGALYAQPRPRIKHTRTAHLIGKKIGGPFDIDGGSPGGWVFLDEPELHFGEDVLVPDVAGYKVERYPKVANDAFLSVAPDWVCEVLSPSTARIDRTLKSQIYAAQGVQHLWLIDPDAQTLEAMRLENGNWMVIAALSGTVDVRVEPFDAITFKLETLWS